MCIKYILFDVKERKMFIKYMMWVIEVRILIRNVFILIVKGDVFVKKVFVSEKFFFVVEFLKELVKLVEVFKV